MSKKNHLVDWKQESIKRINNKNHRDDGLNVRTMHWSALPQINCFGKDKNLSATECILPVDLHGFCIN